MEIDPNLATDLLTDSLKGRVNDPEKQPNPTFEDALEPLCVHVFVQQVLLLGHYAQQIRIRSAVLLSKLSEIVSEKPVDQTDLSRILSLLLVSEHGTAESIGAFFHLIGKSFAIMAIPIIAGLEIFSSSNDWRTRVVCNAAIAQLVLENQAKISKEDRFTTIWNLYFALTLTQSPLFPDRIVILKGLQKLAPLYRVENEELSLEIVSTLLKLYNKGPLEIQTIKETITLIFDGAVEKEGKKNLNAYLNMFLDLISLQDESVFDLLAWAIEQFFSTENKRTKGKSFKSSQSQLTTVDGEVTSDSLQEFSVLLANHFRAPNALIRYGAALAFYSIIQLCPSFLKMNPHLWPFLVSGILDSDHMTAALYLNIVENLKLADITLLRNYIKSYLRNGRNEPSYDDIFIPQQAVPEKSHISTFLDMLVVSAPPIHISLIHKMANSLEFIPNKQKLVQLEQIRVWGAKSKNLDTFLMKMLIPLCTNSDNQVQLAAIRVVDQLLPGFQQATVTDVSFLWKYISSLLKIQLEPMILMAAMKLMQSFPFGPLPAATREEVIQTIFPLVFHKKSFVRMSVYDFFFKTSEVWKANGLLYNILGVLFLSLGDAEHNNVKEIVDMLISIGGAFFGPVQSQLMKLKEARHITSLGLMKLYDQLITALAVAKLEMKGLVETFSLAERVDAFWAFFMHKVPENQLVRPEEYDFTRSFVQNPVFAALLFTKFSVPPPPLGSDTGTRREQMPTTPMGKRRFLCGLLQCLFPSCGSWDPATRRTACVAVVSCCFKGFNVQADMLKALLEFVTQLFLTSKYSSYQMSALDIFGAIVRLKIPGVAETILNQYYDVCIEFLHNTHSGFVASSVLRLLESFLLVFPKGINSKLPEIRDLARSLLFHKDKDVCEQAANVYPLVFKAAEAQISVSFEEYLKNEIHLLQDPYNAEALADPLISQLNANQIQDMLALDILSLGLVSNLPQGTFSNAQYLMSFLVHNNPVCRANALSAIFTMMAGMEVTESASVVWITLPLYIDTNFRIRFLWSRFIRNIPGDVQQRCIALMPHEDDSLTLPTETWEEVLSEHSTLMVNSRALNGVGYEIDQLVLPTMVDIPPEDDGFHLPTMSEKLLTRMKELVQTLAGPLPLASQNLVKYHYQMYQNSTTHAAAVMLLLSEFACLHDGSFADTAQVLLTNLTLDLDAFNWPVLEASTLGLGNILLNSRAMLKQTMEELTIHSGLSEGELSALVFLFDKLTLLPVSSLIDLKEKVQGIVTSPRYTIEKRLLASRLATDCALRMEPDSIISVLDALQSFLDSVHQNDIREKIFKIAGRLLASGGDKHALFKSMAAQSKKNLASKQPEIRMQALSIFRIYAKNVARDEFLSTVYRFLADSDQQLRESARNMLIDDNMLDFATSELEKLKPEVGKRDELLQTCKLPCMNTVGIMINHRSSSGSMSDNTANVDPFNIQFYRSEQRQKFTSLFGMNETLYSKSSKLMTLGVRKTIQVNVVGLSAEEQALYYSENKLHSLRPIQILQALIPFGPSVAEVLVNELMVNLDETVLSKTEGDDELKDIEHMAHKIDVLSNLIIAHGKSEIVTKWLSKLRQFVENCALMVTKLRESLYNELEHSFYFCNQYADIPLVSEEQINSIQEMRDLAQEAILDIVKSGKTDKMTLIENKNDQWNGEVDLESDYLRRLTILSLHVLSGFGLYLTLTKELSDETIIEALEFLTPLLNEEHRGIRLVVIDCCVYMLTLIEKLESRETLFRYIKEMLSKMLTTVETDYNELYRRKADYASLMAQIAVHFPKRELQSQLLKQLLKMWRDADSEVRNVSINLVQHLGESGVDHVLEAFHIKANECGDDIMKELVVLINKDDYPEKDMLRNLLNWRFSQSHKATRPATGAKLSALVS